MREVYLIAENTFRETVRSKTLYSIFFLAAVLIFLSVSFGEWSVFARVQVMKEFGLSTMSLSGLLLAIFIGVGLLGKEISNRTLYNLLVKPIDRTQFLIGKFLGLLATLVLNVILLSIVLMGTIYYLGGKPGGMFPLALVLILIEIAVVVSVAVLCSTFTNPTLASMFTLAFYVIGHYNDLVDIQAAVDQNPAWDWILKTIYYLLPNLEHFNIRSNVVYNLALPEGYIPMVFLYGMLYIALFVLCASLIFRFKDL